jgi:hypothetical protein
MLARERAAKRFQLILIKPSHYDDDGYVIQWFRSSIPANSLACVYGLATGAAQRRVLGEDCAIDITAIDESNTRVRLPRIIRLIRRSGGFGMVGLVGVQSNQFPRAMDIARPLRQASIQVVIGGFHVSGCLAMLPELPNDLQAALDLGCSLFAGEAEDGRLDQVLLHAAAGTLKPIYNFMDDLPGLEAEPTPFLPAANLKRTIQHHASFDAGRGCPFQCSFCTIINVQGRKSRRRSPDDIERLIRQHWLHGIRHFFITDDNFARNRDWEPIFDRIIEIRERDKINVKLVIQVDTGCHKIENFIDKARRAGVSRVFIGLENINPANLTAAKKRQNKITEYRKMLLAWKWAGIVVICGYILGFPSDTPQSILEDIEIIKKELPIDILEFFCLTPLPGSEDHKVLWTKRAWMDADLNQYDLEHVVADHAKMSADQWRDIYDRVWSAYYTREHLMTILQRGVAVGMGLARLHADLFFYSAAHRIEHLHPLQAGAIRLKYRRDRRPGFAIEPVWTFYPRRAWEFALKHIRIARHWTMLSRMLKQAQRRQRIEPYTDLALTPPSDDETETLALFTHNDAARNEVAHIRDVAALTRAGSARARAAERV